MKLCILAAGLGNRMGNYTRHIPKGLLPLGDKPILSYIIEYVPEDVEIVIAVGYKGSLIKQFCLAAYPNRKFVFVDVVDYTGLQSGPGYSLLQCKPHLQEPFYLSTSDDIMNETGLPSLDHNWISVQPTDLPELYSTANLEANNNIVAFLNKDNEGYKYAFTGLAGIKDYDIYWQQLEKTVNYAGEFVDAWLHPEVYPTFKGHFLNWTNVGIIDNYMQARKSYKNLGMPKITGNQTYIVGDKVVKLFVNSRDVYDRVRRAQHVDHLPKGIRHEFPYVFTYPRIPGVTVYETDEDQIHDFINWSFQNRFNADHGCAKIDPDAVHEFYYHKTMQRVEEFLSRKPPEYCQETIINGQTVAPIYDQLHNDYLWKRLEVVFETRNWHGDYQLENVIRSPINPKYTLIDWRDSFAGSEIGDMYYDLAKLYGSLTLPYYQLRSTANYSIDFDGRRAIFTAPLPMGKAIKHFAEECARKAFHFDHIRLLTAIIQLNMAAVHEYPLDDFLFFFSRLALYEVQDGF